MNTVAAGDGAGEREWPAPDEPGERFGRRRWPPRWEEEEEEKKSEDPLRLGRLAVALPEA
ncbi:MAG: hypothetical protein M3455_05545 [Actinomycetota bacterium]|nr:hypothetical protein [Actinomycetota bacterium]